MKLFFLCLIFFSNYSYSKVLRIVQVDKTFFGDITDEMANKVWDDPTIEETHKVENLEAKVGDKIVFVNRDEVNHNVSAFLDSSKIFDVKLQSPGKENDKTIELTKKGSFEIQCAIHPKMKIKLKVD